MCSGTQIIARDSHTNQLTSEDTEYNLSVYEVSTSNFEPSLLHLWDAWHLCNSVIWISWTLLWYGVATTSRLLKIIGLLCKRALQKRQDSANPVEHSYVTSCSCTKVFVHVTVLQRYVTSLHQFLIWICWTLLCHSVIWICWTLLCDSVIWICATLLCCVIFVHMMTHESLQHCCVNLRDTWHNKISSHMSSCTQLQVFFAESSLFCRALLHKRPIWHNKITDTWVRAHTSRHIHTRTHIHTYT